MGSYDKPLRTKIATSPPLTGPPCLLPCALLAIAAVWNPGILIVLPAESCTSCTANTSTFFSESQRETSGIFFRRPSAFQLITRRRLLIWRLRRYRRFFARRLRPPRGPPRLRSPAPPPLALTTGGCEFIYLAGRGARRPDVPHAQARGS